MAGNDSRAQLLDDDFSESEVYPPPGFEVMEPDISSMTPARRAFLTCSRSAALFWVLACFTPVIFGLACIVYMTTGSTGLFIAVIITAIGTCILYPVFAFTNRQFLQAGYRQGVGSEGAIATSLGVVCCIVIPIIVISSIVIANSK